MENDIVVYTVTYVTTRVAVLIGFGYAFYHFLCPARATAHTDPISLAESVRDDRCWGRERYRLAVFDRSKNGRALAHYSRRPEAICTNWFDSKTTL